MAADDQLQRSRQEAHDVAEHRALGAQARAPVAADEVLHVDAELHDERFVQAKRLARLGFLLRRVPAAAEVQGAGSLGMTRLIMKVMNMMPTITKMSSATRLMM